MKITLIAYLHGFGGAEKSIIMLANALQERGHEVCLISLADNNICYSLNEQIDFRFVRDQYVGFFRIVSRYYHLRRELYLLKSDYIINFWYQSVYFESFMNKSKIGKILYSERGDPGNSEYKGLLKILRCITLKNVDKFVFQSEGARDYFGLNVRKKGVVIHNPIFIKKHAYIRQPDRKCVRIVNVGRLHPQKNQELLIKAIKLIDNDLGQYVVEIYGDGVLEEKLKESMKKNKLENKIILKKSTKNIYNCIKDAHMFVLTSDYEGMPNALMEAMALGMPCITTDCRPGGAKSLIKHYQNGIIVPCGDPDTLAYEILHVLSDKKFSERIAENAEKICDTHSPRKIYDLWEKFLNE